MYGFDSRAAMAPGGITNAFGNLGEALLLAPAMARKRQDESDQRQRDEQYRRDQLAQALQIHKDDLEQRKTEDSRRWAEDIGSALNNGAKFVSDWRKTSATDAKSEPVYHPKLTKSVQRYDQPSGHIMTDEVSLSPEEVDQQRQLWDRALHGVPPPALPAQTVADPVLADRQARNQAVQANQMAAGVAKPATERTPAAPAAASAPAAVPVATTAPATTAARQKAFMQLAGDVAPADDTTFTNMMSDDPAVVEQAIRTHYRGRPQEMKKAIQALQQIHGTTPAVAAN